TMISATSGASPCAAPRSFVKNSPASVRTTTGRELPRRMPADTVRARWRTRDIRRLADLERAHSRQGGYEVRTERFGRRRRAGRHVPGEEVLRRSHCRERRELVALRHVEACVHRYAR